jgi:hypothetical protein
MKGEHEGGDGVDGRGADDRHRGAVPVLNNIRNSHITQSNQPTRESDPKGWSTV